MGSPVQFELSDNEARPYVRLTWEPTYWPEIYANYPAVIFPTEVAADEFALGSVTESGVIVKAEVFSKDDILLEVYGGVA